MIIVLDLTVLKTNDQIKNYLIATSFYSNINFEKICKLANGEYADGNRLKKIWLESSPSLIIAIETQCGEFIILERIKEHLQKMRMFTVKETIELSVDSVLDKISSQGMDSLTNEELNILKK